jgi:hypothetical protein
MKLFLLSFLAVLVSCLRWPTRQNIIVVVDSKATPQPPLQFPKYYFGKATLDAIEKAEQEYERWKNNLHKSSEDDEA